MKDSQDLMNLDRARFPARGSSLALVFILAVLACSLPGSGGETPVPPAAEATEAVPQATETLAPEEAADLIFYNGTVLTMEGGAVATAIAIQGERIMTIGGVARILQLAGPETRRIDLAGRTLMPGFVDAHNHVLDNAGGDLEGAMGFALENGITTMADLFATQDLLRSLRALDQVGGLRLRVSLYPVHVDNCGELLGPWYLDEFPASIEPGAMLQIPGVKIFSDGGSCNGPAVSFEYPNGVGNGDLYFSTEALAAIISEVQGYGYQAAVHALGDRAIRTSQEAIEIALAGEPNTFRHRIEHNTILHDELFGRYSQIGIVPTIFGAFPSCLFGGAPSTFKYVTPVEYQPWEWQWRPLLDQNPGLPIAWTSDYPVFSISPFEHLYGFVTRRQVAEDGHVCEPPDWAADDTLAVEEALPMMTIQAAYAVFREGEIGSLKIGKLADLVVLSANPLEVPPEQLREIQVLATVVGGQAVYCAAEETGVCP